MIENTGERYIPETERNQSSEVGIEHLQRYHFVLPYLQGKTVLDAACGEGYGSNMMATYAGQVVGIDICPETIAHAKKTYKKDNLSFIQSSIDALPFPDDSMDIVVSFETIEHVPEEAQVNFINEVRRILKDDGIFILSSPNKSVTEKYPIIKSQFHVKELFKEELLTLLNDKFKHIKKYNQFHESSCFLLSDEETEIHATIKGIRDTDATYIVIVASDVKQTVWDNTVVIPSEERHYNHLTQISNLTHIKNHLEGNVLGTSQAAVYFDTGKGFTEGVRIILPAKTYRHIFDHFIQLPPGVKAVRFDPVEGKSCIVRNLEIVSNQGITPYQNVNGKTVSHWEFFWHTDPQFYVNAEHASFLKISGELFDFGISELWVAGEFVSIFNKKDILLAEKDSMLALKDIQLTEYKNSLAEKTALIFAHENVIVKKEQEAERLKHDTEQRIHNMTCETESRIHDMTRETESRFNEMAKDAAAVMTSLHVQQVETERLNLLLQEKNQVLTEIFSSKAWKMTKPYRWFGIRVKKVAKGIILPFRLLGLFFNRTRTSGLKVAVSQTKSYLNRGTPPPMHPPAVINDDYQENFDFTGYSSDVKVLAFYLPQYHRIPENDMWWGTGFTEWTNTKKSVPRFEGHHQPREPHDDFGYYSLDTMESFTQTMEKQVKLAKQHGIYGFCFYYYWFSGKRLLEKPVDMLLNSPQIDIPFCLCWANENWTRTWDGLESNILVAQDYSDKDRQTFMEDLVPYIQDPRYIRVEGKPVVIVYNPSHIPELKKTMECWRNRAREIGIGEILLWHCETGDIEDPNIFDASIDFPPAKLQPYVDGKVIPGVGSVCNYQLAVNHKHNELKNHKKSENRYKTVMACWDNSARRSVDFTAFSNFSLEAFYRWCYDAVAYTRHAFTPKNQFVFFNAWNEWAEGTYLEPDKKYGYANINTLSKAVFELPFADSITLNAPPPVKPFNAKIAIQIHLYYTDLIDEIVATLNALPYTFDCFISTDTAEKKNEIEIGIPFACVEVFENRGRDVAPFLAQMKDRIDDYDYICHIHSKKSHTLELGVYWREYLYKNLLGCTNYVRGILHLFEQHRSLGLIFPKPYPPILPSFEWGSNKKAVETLLRRLAMPTALPDRPMFPAGNMFWARTSAVKDLFNLGLGSADFPKENDQLDSTTAHAIERIWVYVAQANGYGYLMVENANP